MRAWGGPDPLRLCPHKKRSSGHRQVQRADREDGRPHARERGLGRNPHPHPHLGIPASETVRKRARAQPTQPVVLLQRPRQSEGAGMYRAARPSGSEPSADHVVPSSPPQLQHRRPTLGTRTLGTHPALPLTPPSTTKEPTSSHGRTSKLCPLACYSPSPHHQLPFPSPTPAGTCSCTPHPPAKALCAITVAPLGRKHEALVFRCWTLAPETVTLQGREEASSTPTHPLPTGSSQPWCSRAEPQQGARSEARVQAGLLSVRGRFQREGSAGQRRLPERSRSRALLCMDRAGHRTLVPGHC